MKLHEVIRQRRKELDLTLEDIAKYCGVGKSIVAKWERGEVTNLKRSNLAALADILKVSPLVLMEREEYTELPDNIIPINKFKKIPKVGQIACGTPILAEQNIEEYVDLPSHIHADFALSCKGDSMINAGIRDGDIVYIRQQPIVENGEIAAVLVDSEEATLKRFYLDENMITLQAENPSVRPLIYIGNDMKRIRIIGRAVAYTHAF